MINPNDLLEYVIKPSLDLLKPFDLRIASTAAEHQILGTAAVESKMGYHLQQVSGPAMGIYQIEMPTHNDVLRYAMKKPVLAHIIDRVKSPFARNCDTLNLRCNLIYSTIICRLKYWMQPEPLPAHDDIEGMAAYWKKHYNSQLGKGTVHGFIDAYGNYIRGNL